MIVCGLMISTSSPAHAASGPQGFGQMRPRPQIGRASCRERAWKSVDGIRDVAVTGVQTCALPILALDVPEIGQLAHLLGNARLRPRQDLRALHMIEDLDDRLWADDIDLLAGPCGFRSARLRADEAEASDRKSVV